MGRQGLSIVHGMVFGGLTVHVRVHEWKINGRLWVWEAWIADTGAGMGHKHCANMAGADRRH